MRSAREDGGRRKRGAVLRRNAWAAVAAMALAALITVGAVLQAKRGASDAPPPKGWAAETGFSPHESWNPGPAVQRDAPAAAGSGAGHPPDARQSREPSGSP